MPIELDPIRSGYNLSKINSNFQRIEDAWDEKLDRLVNDQGNQMEQELDMNSNKIINYPPTDLEDPTDLVRVDALNEFGDFTGLIPVFVQYIGDGVTTNFTKPVQASTDARTYQVYLDGIRQDPNIDYGLAGTDVVFVTAPGVGVEISIFGYNPVIIEGGEPIYAEPIVASFVGNGTQTQYIVSADFSTTNVTFISIDGVNQEPVKDFTNIGGVITFSEAPPLNSEIFIRIFAPLTLDGNLDVSDTVVTADGSTTPRRLGDRFANSVNVKDFGAIGDGVANDTPSVQAAIDHLFTQMGGILFFPEGTYSLETLNTYHNQNYDLDGNPTGDVFWANRGGPIPHIELQGDTWSNTVLESRSGNPIFKPEAATPVAYHILKGRQLTFKGFNKTGKPIEIIRDDAYPWKYHFEDCHFVNFEYGFEYDRFDSVGTNPINGYATFVRCQFGYNRCGFSVGGDNTSFYECYTTYNDWTGAWFKSGAVVKYEGGKIEYNGASGWDTWTPPTTGNLTGPFQILIQTGVESLHFDGVYFEPRSSQAANNAGYIPFAMYKEGSLSVIANVVFDGGCRFNGLQSARLLQIDSDVVVQGLTFDSFYLRNLKLNASFPAIISGDSSVNLKDFMWMGGRISDIQDSGGTTIFDWEMFTDFINLEGSMDWSQGSGITSTLRNTEKGTPKQINAHIRPDGSIQFGSGIGVNKESTGKFLITFEDRNWLGSSPSEFYADAQPIFRNFGSLEQHLARIEYVSNNQVRVHVFAYPNDGTYVDTAFTLNAMLVY